MQCHNLFLVSFDLLGDLLVFANIILVGERARRFLSAASHWTRLNAGVLLLTVASHISDAYLIASRHMWLYAGSFEKVTRGFV